MNSSGEQTSEDQVGDLKWGGDQVSSFETDLSKWDYAFPTVLSLVLTVVVVIVASIIRYFIR